MRTIFITVFQGVEFKNIVRTSVYGELVERPDVKLVLFTDSLVKKEYYEREFSAPNVIYEVVEDYKAKGLTLLFRSLKFNLIRTSTMDIKRKQQLEQDRNYVKYYLKLLFNRVFARSFFRKLVRWLDFLLVRDSSFSFYFDKYKPDLVFLAHLFGEVEVAMLREAKRRRIKNIGLINSWDKLTARCMLRLLPDSLVVHNELVKRDAVKYADMPPDNIVVVGVPYFDYYVNKGSSIKSSFYSKYGLADGERIVVFCPAGRTNNKADTQMIAWLDNLLVRGILPQDLKLVVRFPPNDEVILPTGLKSMPIFQLPGKRFSLKRGTDWDMSFGDFEDLANTFYHAAMVICYSSTVVVDAAILDRPIINLGFDFMGGVSRWMYRVDHYRSVLKSGAVWFVGSEDELIRAMETYLKNPLLHQSGRRRLVEEQCWKLDGRSGRRLANYLLALLPADSH